MWRLSTLVTECLWITRNVTKLWNWTILLHVLFDFDDILSTNHLF